MTTKINADSVTGGAVVTADASGVLELQSAGTTALTITGANVAASGNLAVTGNVSVTGSITASGGGIPSLNTPLAVVGNSTAGAEIRLPEDTDNGSNYVALKAPDSLGSNLTFTLPSADGTSGQYLQTNGSGQLAFSTVASGTQQFTSSGSITAGQAVSINSNGTVSATTGISQNAAFSSPSYNLSNSLAASLYDDATGWHIIALCTNNSSADLYVFSYKVNANGTISYGGGAYIGNGTGSGNNPTMIRIAKDTVNNVYGVAVFGYYGYLNLLYAEMTNTTTGAITARSNTYLNYDTTYRNWNMGLCFDSNAARFVVACTTNNRERVSLYAVNYVTKTVTATGTTGASTFYDSSSASMAIAFNSTANNMCLFYVNPNNYYASRIISLNSAGTTFTVGGENIFYYGSSNGSAYATYFPSIDRYVLQFCPAGGFATYLANASGNQVTGSSSAPSNSFSSYLYQSYPDTTNNKLYSVTAYSNIITVFSYSMTASTLTYNGVAGSSSAGGWNQSTSISFDATNGRALVNAFSNSASQMGTLGFLPPIFTTNADKFVGFSTQSVSTGQSVTVTVLGGVNANQTGLTTATAYYLQFNGSLVTSPTQYGVVARALSATSVQVTTGGAVMKLVSQTTISGNPSSVTITLPTGYQQVQIVFDMLQVRVGGAYISIEGMSTGGSALGFYGHGLIANSTSTASGFATSGYLYPHGSAVTASDYANFNGYLTMNTGYANPTFTSMFNTSSTSSGANATLTTGYVSSYPATLTIYPGGGSTYWGGGAIFVYGIG